MNRASRRLRLSQPALSRQMQALEVEVGGALLERGPWGVRPTDLGHVAAERMRQILADYDNAWADLRQRARGQHETLRIGYIGSAAPKYLTPALAEIRAAFPKLKFSLLDLTPREQIEALEKGELDVAMIGQEGRTLDDKFYAGTIATLGVCVAISDRHPKADSDSLDLSDLRDEVFIGASDREVPGRDDWTTALCERAGFRPRYIAHAAGIHELFALVAGEGAVALLPDYFSGPSPMGTRLVPLRDSWATWDFLVLRQRGRSHAAAKNLVEALQNCEPRAVADTAD